MANCPIFQSLQAASRGVSSMGFFFEIGDQATAIYAAEDTQ